MNKEILIKTTYTCPICNGTYNTKKAAEECLAKGFEPRFKVGDIVFARAGFGWYDGKKSWVSNPDVQKNPQHGNCSGSCCTFQFYYVITFIDIDEGNSHRPRYHLFTNAMTGKEGYRGGYTFDIHHRTPVLVKNAPMVVIKDSKKLIGEKAEYLL